MNPRQGERTLDVILTDRHIGTVTQRVGGKYRFEYDEEWQQNPRAIPLSYSMPLQQTRHGTQSIRKFMWGLLPDNEITLRRWGATHHVSPANPFALLSAIGEDCPGAVQLVPPGTNLQGLQNVKWLRPRDLEERIFALRDDPGAGRLQNDTGQFSLAGSQEKTALYRVGTRWGVPQGRTPTTHILKPEMGRVRSIAGNEHFCLLLARQANLSAAESEVMVIGGVPVIVVKRFDRVRNASGVVRVHQEDMCQALGNMEKYQHRGGPGVREIMELLQFSDNPDADRDRFMRAQVFNYLIAGTDAHARNYSISYASGGRFRLSPLYDVISDLPYARNRQKSQLAMNIGGERRLGYIYRKHWEKLSGAVRYPKERTLAHLRHQISTLPELALQVRRECHRSGLRYKIMDEIVDTLAIRCRRLAREFGAEPERNAAPN